MGQRAQSGRALVSSVMSGSLRPVDRSCPDSSVHGILQALNGALTAINKYLAPGERPCQSHDFRTSIVQALPPSGTKLIEMVTKPEHSQASPRREQLWVMQNIVLSMGTL